MYLSDQRLSRNRRKAKSRQHPVESSRHRPMAVGDISPVTAGFIILALRNPAQRPGKNKHSVSTLLKTIQGVQVYQEADKRVHYVADMSVDVDGAHHSYRLDNKRPPALDDIHASAGYPDGSWENVLVPDPVNRSKPFVDSQGFCVSMTSYWWEGFGKTDRRRWVDAETVPYMVLPGSIRNLCEGVVLGCKARVLRTTDGLTCEGVYADSSGSNIGELSVCAAKVYGDQWNANNGDEAKRYLYEFFPDKPAIVNGKLYRLIPA
jgi:hypothetical protein